MYRGRFAPSPTGPLHLGSLVAAVASCVDARAQGGQWLVRVEDVDEPRCPPGMADVILRQLEAFGFAWDGELMYQSRRKDRYTAALQQLVQTGQAYPCACTRREIGDSQLAPDGTPVYPGTCRNGIAPGRTARAWRLRTSNDWVSFEDRWLGPQSEQVAATTGDFILKRADGYFAYQLAVVVDDADQGITDVVRGADLLFSTGRQIVLQQALGIPAVRYLHIPVVVNEAGEKLSKQTRAPALDPAHAGRELRQAFRFLGWNPPEEVETVADIWQWAHSVELKLRKPGGTME
jgi:glutamyl-Q tRNA(Asp) synthetase